MAPELPSSAPHLCLGLLCPADGSLHPCSALPCPAVQLGFAWQWWVGAGGIRDKAEPLFLWPGPSRPPRAPPLPFSLSLTTREETLPLGSDRTGSNPGPAASGSATLSRCLPSLSLSVLIVLLGLNVPMGEMSAHSRCSKTCFSSQSRGGCVLGGRRVPGAEQGPSGAEGSVVSSTAEGVPPFFLTPRGFCPGCRSQGLGCVLEAGAGFALVDSKAACMSVSWGGRQLLGGVSNV